MEKDEKTKLMSKSAFEKGAHQKVGKSKKKTILFLAFFFVLVFVFLEEPKSKKQIEYLSYIIPAQAQQKTDTALSYKYYQEAEKFFQKDTLGGFRSAAKLLQKSLKADAHNAKANALLSICYLRLIELDGSKVAHASELIQKLVDLAKLKGGDLPEVIMAEVEFFLFLNKVSAAQKTLESFAEKNPKTNEEILLLYVKTALQGSEPQRAVDFFNLHGDSQNTSNAILYWKGKTAQILKNYNEAMSYYKALIEKTPLHGAANLGVLEIAFARGHLEDAQKSIQNLLKVDGELLFRQEAWFQYYYSKLLFKQSKFNEAIVEIEKALQKDPENPDFLSEFYLQKSIQQKNDPDLRSKAKMYHFLSMGKSYLIQKKYDEAMIEFLKARQEYDLAFEPQREMGDLFLKKGDLKNAIINYKNALEKNKKSLPLWSKLVQSQMKYYEWTEAKKSIQEIKKIENSELLIFQLSGILAYEEERYPEAIINLQNALLVGGNSFDTNFQLGRAYSRLKKCDSASLHFELAKRLDPVQVQTQIEIADCLAQTDGLDSAYIFLNNSIQKTKTDKSELYATKAKIALQKGDVREAQVALDQAFYEDPESPLPWKIQADLYLAQKIPSKRLIDAALDSYLKYSQKNPSDPIGYLERYKIFMSQGRLDQAHEELNQIYLVMPNYPKLHFYRGVLFEHSSNLSKALEEYQKEFNLRPDAVDVVLAIAQIHLKNQDGKSALSFLEKSLKVNPKNSEIRHLAGYSNFLIKNYSGAVALLKGAALQDSGNPLIQKRLALAYLALDQKENAINSLRNYLLLAPDAQDREEFFKLLPGLKDSLGY